MHDNISSMDRAGSHLQQGTIDPGAVITSIRTEGDQTILSAQMTIDNPPPGVVLDAGAILRQQLNGQKVDRAELTLNVTNLAEGQQYEGVSFSNIGAARLAATTVNINLDRVPPGARWTNLAFDTNATAGRLGSITLGGTIGVNEGHLVNVGFETFSL